eukprot:gene11967-13959_t
MSSTSSLHRSSQHLEYYKELSERTLELCDHSFVQTKRDIIQEFDTLIGYLNDRKIELITQLAVELESHKQELEKNRDKAQHLMELVDRKIRVSNGSLSVPMGTPTLSASSPALGAAPPFSMGASPLSTSFADLAKSDSVEFLKMDQLSLLKESIDVIEWNWTPEFQKCLTRTRIVSTPRPLSPTMHNDEYDDQSDDSSEHAVADEQLGKLNLQSRNESVDSFESGSASGKRSRRKSPQVREKEVNVFGKLDFYTKPHPEYRELNSLLPKQNYIFSVGGHVNGFDQYAMERYDFKEGTWRAMAPIHQMDNDFSSHFDGRNSIYNFGGSLTPAKVTRYSIIEDRWETLPIDIPEGGRFLHSSVYDTKQFIYLLGGFPRAAFVLKFNLVTHEFTKLASMRSLWKMASVYDPTSGSIYTIGGCNISGASVNYVDRYDIATDRWHEVAPLNHGMYSGGAVIDSSNGYIYVFGGYNSERGECMNRVERYSIEHNKWEVVEPSIPTAMIITNSAFFDGSHYVYLVGGSNPNTKENHSNVHRFNIVTFEWEMVTTFQHHRLKGSAVFVSK